MKKFPLFAALALGLSACAPSQTNALLDALLPKTTSSGQPGLGASLAASYAPVNPSWIYGQFFLDSATRTLACRLGYAAAAAGSPPIAGGQVSFTSTDGKVTFQNNFRDTEEVCRNLALNGKALPDSVPPQGVDLYYGSNFYDIRSPLTLVFSDASGQEVARIPVSSTGFGKEWGTNLPEGFFTIGQKSAIASATSFRLLANFGRGIETFEVPQDRLK